MTSVKQIGFVIKVFLKKVCPGPDSYTEKIFKKFK